MHSIIADLLSKVYSVEEEAAIDNANINLIYTLITYYYRLITFFLNQFPANNAGEDKPSSL